TSIYEYILLFPTRRSSDLDFYIHCGMSQWRAAKARRVLSALLRIGWRIKRESGSHRTLEREGWSDYVFAFHDREEIGPRMLARIDRKSTRLNSSHVKTSYA